MAGQGEYKVSFEFAWSLVIAISYPFSILVLISWVSHTSIKGLDSTIDVLVLYESAYNVLVKLSSPYLPLQFSGFQVLQQQL